MTNTPLTSHQIREAYIRYFVQHGHAEIPAANLLPQGDSSLLFVNSGMFPLVPYLLGEKHALGTKLVNYQRCFRTDDIDEVGDRRHTTCFEMLGNWSLGDYFKEEQLAFWYGFLFDELKLDPTKIYQSVFGGNDAVPEDLETIDILKRTFAQYGVTAELGPKTTGKGEDGPGVACDFSTQRIFQYSDKNRWQRGNVVGEVGGPDTETFYDTGREHDVAYGPYCHPNCDCGRFIEIGNSVFMQYVLTESGRQKLDRVNVDFGGGLERVTMAVAGQNNVFLTDIFQPYIQYIEKNFGVVYAVDGMCTEHAKNIEVIVDHARAMTFLMMDGVMISNKDQGYFLRRLIRRVLTKLYVMQVPSKALLALVDLVINTLGGVYPDMVAKREEIRAMLEKEETAFSKNLDKGMKHFEKMMGVVVVPGAGTPMPEGGVLVGAYLKPMSAEDAFLLQTTYGFPIDVIDELCTERGITVDIAGYHALVQAHKDISRQGADKKFKSGLGDNAEQTIHYHSFTHVMHQVLRDLLGDEVAQKGSNLTQERLRFDFSYTPAIDKEMVQRIEDEVNARVRTWFVVTSEIMGTQDAFASGAIGLFGEKYPDQVSVYTMTNPSGVVISKEICTGPHVPESSVLKRFQIKECASIGSNIKRIKAVEIE